MNNIKKLMVTTNNYKRQINNIKKQMITINNYKKQINNNLINIEKQNSKIYNSNIITIIGMVTIILFSK